MKTLIKTKFTPSKGTTIIPFLKNENLASSLDNIAVMLSITAERLKSDFKGDLKETLSFYVGESKIYLLGLGEKPSFNDILIAFRNLSFTQKSKIGNTLNIVFTLSNIKNLATIKAGINGFALGAYRIGLYKSEANGIHPLSIESTQLTIYVDENIAHQAQIEADKAIATAETQIRIMDLVNASPNNKPPQYLADWAIQSGKEYGYEVTVFDKKKCEEVGLKGLLSVSKGSINEPRFIVMEYKPQNPKAKIGLVGKGVTFDTGGISLKPSSNMHFMKSDMGGAAAVLGTMELTAKLQLPIHLIGVIPSTENMIDGEATRPGDVIGSYLGKTVEVIDTDAEGRLILMDGLTYIKKHYNPDSIIDLATLTGSVISTLGYNAAGLFSNNDDLANALQKAGDISGERVWRFPIWDVYMEDMKSDVADISNLSSKPMAGAITAAKFLEFFIDGHQSWAHLDIAGMALQSNEMALSRVATAYGIRLLNSYLEGIE